MKAIHSNLSEGEINEISSIVKRNYPDYRKIANEIDFEFY
jgi:hypothetical protein